MATIGRGSKISIVLPYYNREPLLWLALASIELQTHKNVEVVVVDDGSTKEIDQNKISAGNLEVKYIRQENRGAPAARNRGLEEVSGDFVLFWDQDVYADHRFLEELLRGLESNSSIDFAYCNYRFGFKKMPARKFNIQALKENNFIHTCSLIRTKKAPKWDENLKRFQDWDYFLTMTQNGSNGLWVDKYLFNIKAGGSMSSWLPKFVYKKPWCLLPWIRKRVEDYNHAKQIVINKHDID